MLRRCSMLILVAVVFLCMLGLSHAAEADKGLYASLGVGYSMPNKQSDPAGESVEFSNGMVAKGAFGYFYKVAYAIYVRAELELSYRKYSADKVTGAVSLDGNASYLTGMVNGIVDFKNGTKFTPYVGIGIGESRVSWDNVRASSGAASYVDDSKVVFAYQGMIGVAYDLTNAVKIDLEYRYFQTYRPKFTDSTGQEGSIHGNTNHSILIGARYLF